MIALDSILTAETSILYSLPSAEAAYHNELAENRDYRIFSLTFSLASALSRVFL